MAPENTLLTEQQVADLLCVSVAAVRKWRGESKIAFVKLGQSVRFQPEDVAAFVARGRQAPLCSRCQEVLVP